MLARNTTSSRLPRGSTFLHRSLRLCRHQQPRGCDRKFAAERDSKAIDTERMFTISVGKHPLLGLLISHPKRPSIVDRLDRDLDQYPRHLRRATRTRDEFGCTPRARPASPRKYRPAMRWLSREARNSSMVAMSSGFAAPRTARRERLSAMACTFRIPQPAAALGDHHALRNHVDANAAGTEQTGQAQCSAKRKRRHLAMTPLRNP